jgi:Protein of unknown function (DUF1441).
VLRRQTERLREQGRLLPADDVQRQWAEALRAIAAALDTLPDRLLAESAAEGLKLSVAQRGKLTQSARRAAQAVRDVVMEGRR